VPGEKGDASDTKRIRTAALLPGRPGIRFVVQYTRLCRVGAVPSWAMIDERLIAEAGRRARR
jgi:hypothetical protein